MDAPLASHLKFGPVARAERNPTIDIIRGIALLGILLVNLDLFARPFQQLLFPLDPATPTLDRAADWIIKWLAEGKFYSLFSFLFGLGFGIQMIRAEAREISVVPTYLRRLGILFLIGLAHILLLWAGDILTFYALAGVALLLFRNAKPRTLIVWAVILLAVPLALSALGTAAVVGGRAVSPEVAAQIDRAFATQDSMFRSAWNEADAVYRHGSFVEVMGQRVRDAGFVVFGYISMGPAILGMFLIGLWFARRGVFGDVEGHVHLFRALVRWGLPIGLLGNAIYAALVQGVSRAEPGLTLLAAMTGYCVGVPLLSLAYMSGLTLLMRRETWRTLLRPIGAAGRIPLTVYLAESLVGTTLFYGYGFGLFGRTGKAAGVLIALAVYAGLVWFSVWCTSRYRYGPMEWLWRRGTYGKGI
jgi:uncharacterized protein